MINKKFKTSILYDYLKLINKSNEDIKEFIIELFNETPDYFWTLLASTSKTHHGVSELLIDHVNQCCHIMAYKVWPQMQAYWDNRTKDLALAGMLVHDNWRCGYPGKESFYTKDIIDSKGYPKEILGTLMTNIEHAKIGGDIIDTKLNSKKYPEDFRIIADAVRYHYGPWGPNIDLSSIPYISPIIQVHNVDFHQTNNAELNHIF